MRTIALRAWNWGSAKVSATELTRLCGTSCRVNAQVTKM
jgi:hypothetical protein